jgi:shikimate kinase
MAGTQDSWQRPEPPAERSHVLARAVFLVGFMGSGKSSVGRALSQRLNWRFEDLDERVQAREKRSIAAIFRDSGELAFRQAERGALLELLAEMKANTPVVAALGGGAFTQPENAELLNDAGALTIFLDAPASELWRRCRNDRELVERPLQRDPKQFGDLYEARRPHYLRASLHVDTAGKDIESIVTEIISLLEIDKSGPKAFR